MSLQRVDHQKSPIDSPWTLGERVRMLLWDYVWALCCVWTPKPANPWRILILKLFGAKIYGRPFVHQRARIQVPWNLTLHDRASIGDRANLYTLGEIEVREWATVAQEAYLSTGTHDFRSPASNLMTGKITVEPHVFIGSRAFVMPGIYIGVGAIVGAGSIVTKDVQEGEIVAGNPARVINRRDASSWSTPQHGAQLD
jgi:putative colanic acid biosynthesis acetyltransferase WcaF